MAPARRRYSKDIPTWSRKTSNKLSGTPPIRHTLDAFNRVAQAQGATTISEAEIAELSRPDGRLDHPQPGDTPEDAAFGRPIYLRRHAGKARVTIFEGGHEGIARAAVEWLARW